MPEAKLSGTVIPAGPIYLPHGRHRGPHSGFGVVHIWAEHADEMIKQGFPEIDDVPAYVASLIYEGAPIHFPATRSMRATRLQVIAGIRGIVVLEERQDGENNTFYSIVTAIPGGRRDGPRIGKVWLAPRQ